MTHTPSSPRRRAFVQGALTAGAAALLVPRLARAASPGDKVNLACVGIGNRAAQIILDLHATGLANIVALCDTDMGAPHTAQILKLFPDVPRFRDFRQMFDKMGKQIDAVSIGTPDFSHFPVAMLAMSQGKHVYCEKPMGQSFRQIELMMAAERKYKVAAQMGNQGHSGPNYFQFQAWVNAGVIKNVTRITAYMNNPRRWHGMRVSGYLPAQPLPDGLDWDGWLATERFHAYNKGYVNGDWRSWFDFGNGALGDWGAHIFDTAHEFLQLGLPTRVDAVKLDGHSPFIFPQASTLGFHFPARGALPPLDLTWYDGKDNLPPLPANMGASVVDPSIPPPSKGANAGADQLAPGKIIYGEGLTFKGGTHGSELQILDGEKSEAIRARLPAVPVSPSNHYANFLRASMGQETCRSSFAIAGPLCQTMSLGVIAQRVNATIEFDPVRKRVTNHRLADSLLDGVPPRKEWEQFYKM
jgi:predicted dehydrogenase